jgi:hypothetical protein
MARPNGAHDSSFVLEKYQFFSKSNDIVPPFGNRFIGIRSLFGSNSSKI